MFLLQSPALLTQAQVKPKLISDGIIHFFTRADSPRVYVCAPTLCYFRSLISTQTFRRALTADGQMRGDSGVTNSGRVWSVPSVE